MPKSSDGTTTASDVEPWLAEVRGQVEPRPVIAFVIAWSAAEPQRTGQVTMLEERGPARLLGRGPARLDDPCPRLAFGRPRPFAPDAGAPLQAPGLSRKQLLLTPREEGVAFERLGSGVVRLCGRASDRGLVRPGETLEIQNELILLCTRRPSPMLAARHVDARAGGLRPFGRPDRDGIVGESAAIWTLREEIAFAAASPVHVLVVGDSGTGKELVAAAIHRQSSRGTRPVVARSAVSFPETLIDAELFGNMRDYPNPGMAARPGLIGAADGTSLFLDEVGELPVSMQAHLLRVLDAGGHYHRLGESAERKSDFRLIAATNRPLSALKADFAARFQLVVRVPSLSDRRDDIPLLCDHLLERIWAREPALARRFLFAGAGDDGAAGGGPRFRFDPAFMQALLQRDYQGHLRELQEILWAALRESPGGVLVSPRDLAPGASPAPPSAAGVEPTTDQIREALARHGGNRSRAYRDLGLSSRYALRRLLRKRGPIDGGVDS